MRPISIIALCTLLASCGGIDAFTEDARGTYTLTSVNGTNLTQTSPTTVGTHQFCGGTLTLESGTFHLEIRSFKDSASPCGTTAEQNGNWSNFKGDVFLEATPAPQYEGPIDGDVLTVIDRGTEKLSYRFVRNP